jgi:hypothetical protein
VVILANISACLSGDDGLSYSLRIREPRYFDLGTLFGRVERLEARHRCYAPSAVVASPRRLDAALLEQGRAFERAWAKEVAALIVLKRNDTPEARFATRRARAACERLATRIELARAATLDGLKVKARAILWRRNGEPLGRIGSNGQPIRPAE